MHYMYRSSTVLQRLREFVVAMRLAEADEVSIPKLEEFCDRVRNWRSSEIQKSFWRYRMK